MALIAAATLWIVSGFGWKLHSPRFEPAHYHVLRVSLGLIVWAAQHLFRLRLETDEVSWSPLDDGVSGSDNAMIVLSRHAGPGDSFLLVHHLLSLYRRRPRIVMKAALQFDPSLDVVINRLPHAFVPARRRLRQAVPPPRADEVVDAATGLRRDEPVETPAQGAVSAEIQFD